MEKAPGDLAFLNGLEDYCVAVSDGVRFIDPIYHEAIKPLQPPRCVTDHPQLGAGCDFLQTRAGLLKVNLVVALHGRQSDFDELTAQYGTELTNGVVGVEADWTSQPEASIPEIIFSEHAGRAAFQQQQSSWLRSQNNLVLPCEYLPQNEPEDSLAQKMAALWSAFLEASKHVKERPDETIHHRVANATFWACQSIRQWAILGRFGYWLKLLDEEGYDLPDEASLILGVGHNPSAERLSHYFGIQTETVPIQHSRLLHEPTFQEYFAVFFGATTQGHATYEQLDTPFAL